MTETQYDLLIIGGGINGVGIARDAAGRGLRVCLIEKDDFAAHTSSHSSKLIHGGLRYLQYGHFGLVKAALQERSILLQTAPHLVHPLPFVMPQNPAVRSPFMIKCGLFIYRALAAFKTLPMPPLPPEIINLPLKKAFSSSVTYMDCAVNDARLVIVNAIAAHAAGATLLPHTRLVTATPLQGIWQAEVRNGLTQTSHTITAQVLVNATGPWVNEVATQHLQLNSHYHLQLVQGSHIVVPKLYAGDHAYVLQHTDKRIIFVLPFAENYHLIGTTETDFHGDLDHLQTSQIEIDYLCGVVNHYFIRSITAQDIIWHYSGVRPLVKDGNKPASAINREYSLELTLKEHAPVLTVLGGKITTYRLLAEHALKKLKPFFKKLGPCWTQQAILPGGDFEDFNRFIATFNQQYAWLPPDLATRYAITYGTLAHIFLQNKNNISDLGEHFGHGLYQTEILYLLQHEWACTAEDILFRRTQLGVRFTQQEQAALALYLSK